MSHGHYHIPMSEIMGIEVKLADRVELQTLLKQYIYEDSKSINQNLRHLSKDLKNYLCINGKTFQTLQNFLVEKNISIQVNFKPLKIEQLIKILEQWLSMYTESSTILQKLYTIKHRNIHFPRILFDQQQTINDYFSTLSDKKMLKAVNLYQLLVQIFSNCYLYQYRSDTQTFFEKVNSFNTFVDIVKKFIHSQKRISLVSNKEDFEFIQRIQFQRLIQFWQEQNNQLELLTQKRININQISVQTTLINIQQTGIQTRNSGNLTEFINYILFSLNKFTSYTENVKQLASIQRLYSALRKQKMYLLGQIDSPSSPRYEQKYAEQNSTIKQFNQNSMFFRSVNQSKTIQKIKEKQSFIEELKFKDQIDKSRLISPNHKISNAIQAIYNYYQQIEGFTLTNLQKCLIDLGVIDTYHSKLINTFQKKRMIRDKMNVTEKQFKEIMKYLMQIDKQLTIEVLQDFIKHRRNLKVVIKTPKVKSYLEANTNRFDSFFMKNKSRNYIGRYIDRSYL